MANESSCARRAVTNPYLFCDELNEYVRSIELPVTKTPVFYWEKKRTKKDEKNGMTSDRVGHYWNASTCCQGYALSDVVEQEDDARVLKVISKDIGAYYILYVSKLNALIFGEAWLDGRAVHPDSEPRKWRKGCAVAVDTWKNLYEMDSFGTWNPSSYSSYCGFGLINLQHLEWVRTEDGCGWKEYPSGINGEYYAELAKPIVNLFPRICNIGSNHTVDITESAQNLCSFLEYKEPVGRSGPKAEKIDDLVSHPLPEPEYRFNLPDRPAYLQRVDDDTCVLRTMRKNDKDYCLLDCARLYITKKDVIACRPTNFGGWIDMKVNSKGNNWNFNLLPFEADVVKGTKVEYLADIFPLIPLEDQGKLIWAALTNPLIEQVAKADGAPLIAYVIRNSTWSKPKEMLDGVFGPCGDKGGLLKRLGCNKMQYEKIIKIENKAVEDHDVNGSDEMYWRPPAILKWIKEIMGNDDDGRVSVSWMDDETTNWLIDIVEYADKSSYTTTYCDVLRKVRLMYSATVFKKIANKAHALLDYEEGRFSFGGYPVYLMMYHDFLEEADLIRQFTGSMLSCDFDENNLRSVQEMHDAATAVYNAHADTIQYEGFVSAAQYCRKWQYEDDDFAVIAPESPEELVNEGIALHHCVGSYVRRVVDRMTNIMFLRRQSDRESSFFTMEITNDGTVQQIHGACNHNLTPGIDDDVIAFVGKWSRAKGLRLGNYNQLR